MRHLLFSLLLLCTFCKDTPAQSRSCKDCIPWTADQKLEWSDFKGKPDRSSRNKALADSGMSIELKCDSDTSEVIIKCFFDRSRSWTKDTTSVYLLGHEQLHFDITELFVRKLRKRLAAIGNDCNYLNDHIEKYYNENYKEYVKFQDSYDRETEHSINREKQAVWEEKVKVKLEELRDFGLDR